jgi:hypothetical protein
MIALAAYQAGDRVIPEVMQYFGRFNLLNYRTIEATNDLSTQENS